MWRPSHYVRSNIDSSYLFDLIIELPTIIVKIDRGAIDMHLIRFDLSIRSSPNIDIFIFSIDSIETPIFR